MSLEDRIRQLPPERQAEVLDFVEFLHQRTRLEAGEPASSAEGLVLLFGKIDYTDEYDYKAARRRDGK